jgi:hypothetical protein
MAIMRLVKIIHGTVDWLTYKVYPALNPSTKSRASQAICPRRSLVW